MRSALQDREAVIQKYLQCRLDRCFLSEKQLKVSIIFVSSLRVQLGLGKLPRPAGPAFDDVERPAAEQKLMKLRSDVENKKVAMRNLKSTLDKLDITE